MDFKQIQELIKMVNKSNIGELTVELKDFRVTIKQKEDRVQQIVTAPMHSAAVMPQMQHAPVHTAAPPATTPAAEAKKEAAPVASNTITIKSPMIGTFYRKAGP